MRKGVGTGTCPRSYVTAESVGLIEEFLVRRQLGGAACEEMPARKVEAFLVLERELARERTEGGGAQRE